MNDAGGDGARGTVPAEAVDVGKIVRLFDSERASGVLWSAEEFKSFSPRKLTGDEMNGVRATRGDLLGGGPPFR